MTQRLDSRFFLRGLGRALDPRGATSGGYSARREWHRSDRAAMASGWSVVFRDLGQAYERVTRRGGRDA